MPLQVIEVRAKKRTGDNSLVTALRKSLEGHYPDKSLALGGTFIIQKGKAKIHIMVNMMMMMIDVDRHCQISFILFISLCLCLSKPREFSVCPLHTNDDVNKWLKHFEVSAPLICQSVLVSRDPVSKDNMVSSHSDKSDFDCESAGHF